MLITAEASETHICFLNGLICPHVNLHELMLVFILGFFQLHTGRVANRLRETGFLSDKQIGRQTS